jgi:hypothetical protein
MGRECERKLQKPQPRMTRFVPVSFKNLDGIPHDFALG